MRLLITQLKSGVTFVGGYCAVFLSCTVWQPVINRECCHQYKCYKNYKPAFSTFNQLLTTYRVFVFKFLTWVSDMVWCSKYTLHLWRNNEVKLNGNDSNISSLISRLKIFTYFLGNSNNAHSQSFETIL